MPSLIVDEDPIPPKSADQVTTNGHTLNGVDTSGATDAKNVATNGEQEVDRAGTTDDVAPKDPVKIKDEEVGLISQSKDIYRSKKDDNGEFTWVDKYPEDVPEAAENDETARYAVIVRKKKSADSRKKLEAHSLIVQSPWLKTALAEILEGYPGVTCEIKRLTFEAPFAPFVRESHSTAFNWVLIRL